MIKRELKTKIDNYYNLNYNYVQECSYNILKKINRVDLKDELITESYLYMTKNAEKLEDYILEGKSKIESIVVNFMNMQIVWSNTNFKREHIYRDKKINGNILVEDLGGVDSGDITEEEYLAEEMSIQNALGCVKAFISKQDMEVKTLFNTVFILGYSTSGKLSKYIGVNRTTCYYMIRDLKNLIKENCVQLKNT
tara:strand:- start:2839 stop:3423 length:585 start_codon:yes stop_codon:yes gene_type:complete